MKKQFTLVLQKRLLIQDYEKKWNIQELSEQLSDLADLIIDTTLSCVLKTITKDIELGPQIAIIAFGKLGFPGWGPLKGADGTDGRCVG